VVPEKAVSGDAMAALLKPLSHLAAIGAEPVIRKPIPVPKIVEIQEPVVSGEVLNEVKTNLQDGEPSQRPHHLEVIPAAVHKPNPLVGVVAPAGVEVKPPRQARVVAQLEEEGVNF
jgi:hypothetical protein